MAFTPAQVMLTLAGLTYRGFHDVLPGEPHDELVRGAVSEGLHTLAPVQGDWELVWGPVTSRGPRELIDSNAMYIVRHAREPTRYVVAIRGTNPISLSDWLFGDFWVGTTVPWPYAPAGDGAAISASTALGLGALQAMRARPTTPGAGEMIASVIGRVVDALTRAGAAVRQRLGAPLRAPRLRFSAQLDDLRTTWQEVAARHAGLTARVRQAMASSHPLPATLRPRPAAGAGPQGERDLLTFLAAEAAAAVGPLDVTVTGHSKGAALAQAAALWLREALAVAEERWDAGRGARVRCAVFAGPTPGNTAFARRFEAALGGEHQHVRNANDIVTHAWQVEDLRAIPTLYGGRTAMFGSLIGALVADVEPLDYRHVEQGVQRFEGGLDPDRGFVAEFIEQHLDAYLATLGLHALGIDALTFFF